MPSPDNAVESLVDGCRRNDKKAQRSLYYTYHSMLMNLCMRYSKDSGEAEQLVHDSFLKIFTHIHSFGKGSLEGWMKKICVNTCLDNYRKQQTQSNLTEEATIYKDKLEDHISEYASNDIFKKLSLDVILRLIERLPEKEKLVFKLYVLDGYSHEEISVFSGISLNHSYWLLHNARKLLRSLLTENSKSNQL